MRNSSGAFGGRVLGTVLALTICLPIAAWTGVFWHFLVVLLPLAGSEPVSRKVVWLTLVRAPRPVVVLFAGVFTVLGAFVGIAPILLYVPGELPWLWALAELAGLFGAALTYTAVCRICAIAWISRYLYDYRPLHQRHKVNRLPPGRPDGRTVFSPTPGRERARQLIGLPIPPVRMPGSRPIFNEVYNEVAEFQLQIAGEYMDADRPGVPIDHIVEEALRHCAEASALRRHITEKSRYAFYFRYFAEALAYQADCLSWAGRLDEATVVGAEELAARRRFVAALGGDIETPTDFRDGVQQLADALVKQADRLQHLDRSTEAEALAAEAEALA